jgi:uncharacterized protein
MREIEFKSGNDETVRGVLCEPAAAPPHPALILAHGLLSTHEEFGDYPAKFAQRGYVVLAIDFRGHGKSGGMRGLISEERMVEDLHCAVDWVTALQTIDAKRIALFGHSLGGGGVICATARDSRVRAVIAGATVGCLRDELRASEVLTYRIVAALNRMQKTITHRSLYLPYRVTYKDIFHDPTARATAEAAGFLQTRLPADNVQHLLSQNAIECARHIRVPALIVQGEFDQVVRHASTQAVYDAIPGEKEFYEVKNSGHSFATDSAGAGAFEHIAGWVERNV